MSSVLLFAAVAAAMPVFLCQTKQVALLYYQFIAFSLTFGRPVLNAAKNSAFLWALEPPLTEIRFSLQLTNIIFITVKHFNTVR